jgi:hypothetical protein
MLQYDACADAPISVIVLVGISDYIALMGMGIAG